MKFPYSLIAAFLTTLLFANSLQGQELPKAPEAEVFALTPEPGYFTEPGVAVNPSDPKQVVAVFQDNAHAAYSRDKSIIFKIRLQTQCEISNIFELPQSSSDSELGQADRY